MEGVGARLGRSSTRYVPTTVFTGPVRRWKKKWVHVPPPNSSHHHHTAANGTVNGGNDSSHLLLYRWTPIAPSQTKEDNHNDNSNGNNKGDAEIKKAGSVAAEDPPKKKFKYIPIVVLEEQDNEALEQIEDETEPIETDASSVAPTTKSDGFGEKPDINDVPMDDSQAKEDNHAERQYLNESTLDLSLGLKAHDDENESNSKAADQSKDDL